MSRVMDPVFAMDESFFLDGGSRLDDVDLRSLASVSETRSVARRHANVPDVGRCLNEYGSACHASTVAGKAPQARRPNPYSAQPPHTRLHANPHRERSASCKVGRCSACRLRSRSTKCGWGTSAAAGSPRRRGGRAVCVSCVAAAAAALLRATDVRPSCRLIAQAILPGP